MLEYPTRFDPKRMGNGFLQYYPPQNAYHPGVDFNWGIGNQDKWQDVVCPTWGTVEYVSPKGTNGGLGNYVVVHHPTMGVWTRFLHLDSISVVVGQKLSPSQFIGKLGDTGTLSAHLHFEVLNDKGLAFIKEWKRPYGRYPAGMAKAEVAARWIDPMKWIAENSHVEPFDPEALRKRRAAAENALKWAPPERKNLLTRLIERIGAALAGR